MTAKTWADFGIDLRGADHGEVDVTCPECSHTRKKKHARCLSVNVDKGVFLCNHCGWRGGLGEGTGRVDPGWRKPAYRKPAPIEAKPVDPITAWFDSRGIPKGVLERNRVTPATVYMPQAEDHVAAVAFPYYRGDELVNVKYRDREKNFRMEAGAERVLYGLNDVQPERCVIVEGEVDKLSVETAGITSCVSVPDGAPSETAKDYASKFTFLEADSELLQSVREWVIAVDNDGPGRRLEDELCRRLGREKCHRVTWPSDCKDANDVLVSFGPELLRECIDNAEPYPIEGTFQTDELEDDLVAFHAKGFERGLSTGWEALDEHYTVRAGEMTIVTGIPNSGKSAWMDSLMVNVAREHGWHIAIFSPENQPLVNHMARVLQKWSGVPFHNGPTQRMSAEDVRLLARKLASNFTWILPDDDSDWTVSNVLDKAKQLVFRRGIRGLVIDPWNELEHNIPQGMTETIYINHALKHVRQWARKHGVHVWIVAHPAKLYREKDTGNYPIPTLYDINGSAAFRNKADCGIVVWRDFKDENKAVEVHVQKIRFSEVGKLGMAKLKYDRATQGYREFQPFESRSVLAGGYR
jgi:twinkle protein